MQAVVLCGGLATRLGARAAHVPKILLEIAGQPFLDRVTLLLARAGFTRALLLAGHLGDAIEAAAARGPRHLALEVLRDGPTLLGTGGALRAALDRLDDTFLVTYGDSYLRFDYAAPLRMLRADASARGCMATFANDDAIEPSNVAVADGKVVRYDKERAAGAPALTAIDYGATALRREALLELPARGASDLAPLLSQLAARGELLACPAEARFFEIGSEAGIAALEAHLEGAG
jgi:NDP-sugar pyrophosphorylase family protein